MNRIFLLSALIFASVLQSAIAEDTPLAMWEGRWGLDRASSHLVGVAVEIQHLSHSYRFDLGGTVITVGDDGKDYPTAPTRTTSFKQTGRSEWVRVHKINGKTLDTSIFTMAKDEQSFHIHTLVVDDAGMKHVSEETFLREGHGTGIGGTWRSTKVGANTAERISITREGDHQLRINFPDQKMLFVTPLDGSAVAYSGERAVPSVQISVSKKAFRLLQWTDLLNGKPYMEGQYILSPDGHHLTVSSWHVTSPREREQAVYIRQ